MKIVSKPTEEAKHYLTFKGAEHLGACDDALNFWEKRYGIDRKFEVDQGLRIFEKRVCVSCFVAIVLKQLIDYDDANDLPDNKMVQNYQETADICTCAKLDKSLMQKDRAKLVYLLRCLVETCSNNKPKVECMQFEKLGR